MYTALVLNSLLSELENLLVNIYHLALWPIVYKAMHMYIGVLFAKDLWIYKLRCQQAKLVLLVYNRTHKYT